MLACPRCGHRIVPEDGPGQARRKDPPTAKAAGAIVVRRGTQRHTVLEAVRAAGSTGATSHELELTTMIPYASLTPRIGELKHGGFIEASGRTRPSQYGTQQEVLTAVLSRIPERHRDLDPEPRELPDPDEYRDLDKPRKRPDPDERRDGDPSGAEPWYMR